MNANEIQNEVQLTIMELIQKLGNGSPVNLTWQMVTQDIDLRIEIDDEEFTLVKHEAIYQLDNAKRSALAVMFQ